MTDIKVKRSKTLEHFYRPNRSRKTPMLREVQIFLDNHNHLSSVNGSSSKIKCHQVGKLRSRESDGALESSFELKNQLARRASQHTQNASMMDHIMPFDTIPKNDAFHVKIVICLRNKLIYRARSRLLNRRRCLKLI